MIIFLNMSISGHFSTLLKKKHNFKAMLMQLFFIFFLLLACKSTFYGTNCTQKCNKICINENCHHETGKCIEDEQVCYPVLSTY